MLCMAGRWPGGKVVAGDARAAGGASWVEGVALTWVQCARVGRSVVTRSWWASRAACCCVSVSGVRPGSIYGGWRGGVGPSSGWGGWLFVRVCGRALGGGRRRCCGGRGGRCGSSPAHGASGQGRAVAKWGVGCSSAGCDWWLLVGTALTEGARWRGAGWVWELDSVFGVSFLAPMVFVEPSRAPEEGNGEAGCLHPSRARRAARRSPSHLR